jgi:multiple sugar transport system permease protein
MLPLSRPALMTVAVFTFMWNWNDFFGPLIYLSSKEKYTLALGLQTFIGQYTTQWHYLMAASLVVVLPMILLFFFAQRAFIEGIAFSGLKG